VRLSWVGAWLQSRRIGKLQYHLPSIFHFGGYS
jgi:hypothetical protein